jgi:hydrogenase expression/formation protein HypC
MCLGIPGEVIDRYDDRGTAMGRVAFGSITKEVCLALVDAEVGEYVIVHAGVAITVLDEATAVETIELFEQMIGADEAERIEQ